MTDEGCCCIILRQVENNYINLIYISPAGAKDFSPSLCVQTGSGANQASYPMGTERGKARPGREADHSPPSSGEVKFE
jgi:hypothetical protein